VSVYQQEETLIRNEIQILKENNTDVYDIMKREEALAETLTVLPNTKNRLEQMYNELVTLMEEMKKQDDFNELAKMSEWGFAQKARDSVSPVFFGNQ